MQIIRCTCGTGRKCLVPHGRWIVRKTSTDGCSCDRKCPSPWCFDVGRVDAEKLPASCCAHRIPLDQAMRERAAYRAAKIRQNGARQ